MSKNCKCGCNIETVIEEGGTWSKEGQSWEEVKAINGMKTTYGSGDYTAYFDGFPVNNLESIAVVENAQNGEIVGSFVLAQYLENPLMGDVFKWSKGDSFKDIPPINITLIATNQYGEQSYKRIEGVTIVTQIDSLSAGDLTSSIGYDFIAENIRPLRLV